ncbi:HamA C-terminal domain-containing protein [Corynebacterium striatum]|uniref:HamA C-terminal domain-containing protein n=1 Tax=Corynebacterium striatum TaxID=43770 RepID=UPI00254B2AF8|nr:DUF1837 domain-containing protein [Corynebacterium striatum]MDK8826519.1 DUF1837 domain-containing protein [Corynebacterium striatum]
MSKTNQPLDLDLTIVNREEFLGLFYEPVDFCVNRRTKCKLSVMKIENGNFILDQLYDAVADASLSYVLSRKELNKFLRDPKFAMSVTNKVRAKFQSPNDTNGEGGEVLLYALLEAVTGAPKLLSKMGLKTSNEMPVFGSDGLHILKTDEKNYQLIFGESKMYGDLGRAISNAFESMHEASMNNFINDMTLVAPQLMRESVSEQQLDYLEKLLIPPLGAGMSPPKQAFGVFVAFDIDVDDYELEEHSDDEIETEFLARAKAAMESKIPLITNKIRQFGFGAVPFHIFAIPFLKRTVNGQQTGAAVSRKAMQRRLRFGYISENEDVA